MARLARDRVRIGSSRKTGCVRDLSGGGVEPDRTARGRRRRCRFGAGVRARRFIHRLQRDRRREESPDGRRWCKRRAKHRRSRRGRVSVPSAMDLAESAPLHGRRADQTASGRRRRGTSDRAHRRRVVHAPALHPETPQVRSRWTAARPRDHASGRVARRTSGRVRGGRRPVDHADCRNAAAAHRRSIP